MPIKRKKVQNYYLLTFNENWADEHDVPALACFNKDEYIQWSKMKITPYAHLGNNGDGFEDNFKHHKTGLDFIKDKDVQKTIVDKAFYNIFHKVHLDNLSLSTIFNIEEQEAINRDSDEENDEPEDLYLEKD